MWKWLVILLVVVATPALAAPIPAVDLNAVLLGNLIADTTVPIETAAPPPITMGSLDSEVYFNGTDTYTYVNTVTPTLDDVSHFNTAFEVRGFTGSAGWRFSDAAAAGGTGTPIDFLLATVGDRIHWLALDRSLGSEWDAGESITFFFRSTLPPRLGDYNLLNGEAGTGRDAFAPVPEPGSIMLLGSGLVGLYAHLRRRNRAL